MSSSIIELLTPFYTTSRDMERDRKLMDRDRDIDRDKEIYRE